jgi:hypothetical protein
VKVIWEEIDIKPGRKFLKPGCGLSGQYIMGYRFNIDHPDCGKICGVVNLADGQFVQLGSEGTPAQVVEWLNRAGCYIPMELL